MKQPKDTFADSVRDKLYDLEIAAPAFDWAALEPEAPAAPVPGPAPKAVPAAAPAWLNYARTVAVLSVLGLGSWGGIFRLPQQPNKRGTAPGTSSG